MGEVLSKPVFVRYLMLGFIASAALFILSGCASSGLVNMWRDPSFQQNPMNKMLVIAVKKDPVRRRMWEDGFVAELEKRGVTATPSYRLFPEAVPDTQQVVEAIQNDAYDGILVTRKRSTDTSFTYVPGYTSMVPVTRYNRWTDTYYTYYQLVQDSGYTEMDKTVRYQTDVWTTKKGGMVWSGTTESINPSSSQDVNHEITRMIVPELAKQGIIPSKEVKK